MLRWSQVTLWNEHIKQAFTRGNRGFPVCRWVMPWGGGSVLTRISVRGCGNSHIPGRSRWDSVSRCHPGKPWCCCWWKSLAGLWSSPWRRRRGSPQSAPRRRSNRGTRRTAEEGTHTATNNTSVTTKQITPPYGDAKIVFFFNKLEKKLWWSAILYVWLWRLNWCDKREWSNKGGGPSGTVTLSIYSKSRRRGWW